MFKIKSIDRKPMVSKSAGNPYTQLVIITEDGRRCYGFGNKDNESWAIGHTIQDSEAVIAQNGQYYNIEMVQKPKQSPSTVQSDDKILKELNEINIRLDEMNTKLLTILNKIDDVDLPI